MAKKTKHECKRCGYCCGLRVKLTKEDINRIVNLGYRKDFFVTHTFWGQACLKQKDNNCIFMGRRGDKTFCKVYPARPELCIKYPPFDTSITKCNEWDVDIIH